MGDQLHTAESETLTPTRDIADWVATHPDEMIDAVSLR